ncbi:tetratricopeptide repeat-containing sensor histidine kinase [Tenacibaculum jejuense]|uniref:histidine kinase n=1 Tax=Tenacibaculum jejuense TaxID=584609 RepID=A0A238UAI9_9FLAO|nr:HAMP domain-containing sensor histidine kinase [Tenacibaculum jejuense]SNR16006.1 putative Membrane associated signal transduction histidine kinase [Tenacibaculum jejuense]
MNKVIVFIYLLISLISFSQKSNYLHDKGNLICNESKELVYCKAIDFYRNQQYDSCYTYSNRALIMTEDVDKRDFFNCILGYSAFAKGLNKKSLSCISNISESDHYKQIKKYLLGNIYLRLGEYQKAIESIESWISNDSNSSISIKKVMYHNLALCYLHKKKFKKANFFFDKELKLLSINDTVSLIKTKLDLANAYYEQYLDNDAIPLFEEAYNLAKNYSDVKLKHFTSESLAYVYKDQKKNERSITYFIEAIKWKDSIWNRDRIIELADQDKKLTVAQKDKEIAVQDEKLKRKEVVQRGLLFGASGLLLFIGALGFFYSKLRKQNTLITQQKEDLAIANKTKNYLFSVVSHDLRSPMNTIKYQHEQLKKYIETNNLEGIKEANNTAITVTESTSHLLNNVLHWSLEQSNQMVFAQKAYPLKPIVEHVLYDYENLIEANAIEISTNYIQNSIVNADRESIKIVLRNLLDNAVKYMNGKGKISVEIGVDSENYSYVAIQDTGIGIPKDRLEKINALKGVSIDKIDRSEGVGLGLILCQTLVKKNNGILSFDSEVGKGTKVTIQLPIVNE